MKIEPHLESMLPQLELRVLFGPQSGSRLTLSPGDYLLGTDEDCAVMLSGPRMQGIHARLAFDGDRPSIEPMDGSVTDAQGRSVDDNIALALGMPVELGGVWIAIDEIDAPWPDLDAVIPQPGTHPHTAAGGDDTDAPTQAAAEEISSSVDKHKPEVDKQRRRAKWMLITSVTVLVMIALAGIGGASWLADVAPGRYMSVLPGRDGKPEIIGYVSDEAMESAVRDAIRKIVNTPAVHLYVDQQLLVQTRKAAQTMKDPTHALFEVSDVRNGVAVLNGTVISQAAKDDLAESLRSRVPGLRGTEAPLRMAEELKPCCKREWQQQVSQKSCK
ncbi:MAG: FHA domain-containing protein [Betaproteobacteria bacterium]